MILGIDPGLKGGISAIDKDSGRLVLCGPLPLVAFQLSKDKKTIDGRLLAQMIFRAADIKSINLAVIEEVSAAPNQGVVSMFNFGMGYGLVLGVLQALDIRILKVRPSVWKSAFGLNSDKQRSLAKAAILFPEHCNLFKIKKNDGLAESALLAEYGRRIKVDSFSSLL